MEKFLIIDGNSIMNRAFYGISARTMMTAAGISTNAVYGFLNIYWMIENMLTPDYVAVSFDLRAPTFRHKLYDEYKGTRKGMPDELRPQMPVIKEVLEAMNIPILELETYEADDILGTVAKRNEEKGIFTYILSGDRDAFQLISDKTSVVIPTTKMGKTDYTIYTPELLKENYGILPYQVVDVKALMGDSSDNIPGVKGIGEKTAYTLITKYATLECIYKNIGIIETTDKVRSKLNDDKEMAFLSYQLATIYREVPIEIDYEACRKSEVNKEKLYRQFRRLNFNKFMSKFDFTAIQDNLVNNDSDITVQITTNSPLIYLVEGDKKALTSLLVTDKLSYYLHITELDYITNTLSMTKDFLAIFCQNTIYVITLMEPSWRQYVLEQFAASSAKKMGYNIKQDLRYLLDNNISTLNHFAFDMMIAAYLIDSNKNNYLAEMILGELFSINFKSSNNSIQLSMFDTMSSIQNNEYLEENECYNLNLLLKGIYYAYDIITEKLKSLQMDELFETIEMPLTETLASMEHEGMYIDLNKLNEFDVEVSDIIHTLEQQIHSLAGEEFNINSPKQLGDILFEKLQLPVIKKSKTGGYSTDKEVLEELEEKHEIIGLLLEYRQVAKLKSTYVDSLKDKIAKDGRIHTTFMQTVASTGRLSSTEPNLQNIPIRLELGSKIRSFFVAQGKNMLVDSDYSQIELRVLADMSNDTNLIEAFNSQEDIHKVTASQVFDVPLKEVTPSMRTKAKAVNFGIVYGISDFGLSKNLGSTIVEAGNYISNYFAKYHGVKQFMESIIQTAKDQGYVSTLFGRRRYINEIFSPNRNIQKFGERIAMNTPIQGTAADIIKKAMNVIYFKLKEQGLRSKLLMQVHDELIIEMVPEEQEIVSKMMKESMENVVQLKVPLVADSNIAKTWYDAK